MTRRGIFLADGPSDLPLSPHLESICAQLGADVAITRIDPTLLPAGDRTVVGRLRFVLRQQGDATTDIAFVHRDAESDDPKRRRREIDRARETLGVGFPVVPVVPVRMTESWLLLDEAAIRTVAGNPHGRHPLDLPTVREVERIADAKQRLRTVLLDASATSGAKRKRFERDFGRHRALLLQRLDPTGPVSQLASWRRLLADTADALEPS